MSHEANIRRDVVAGQRGRQYLFFISQFVIKSQHSASEFTGHVQQVPQAMNPMQAPQMMPQPILLPQASGGVRVSTPIMSNPMSTQAFPVMFNATPTQPGYNAALQHFHELSNLLKSRAYNLDKGQSVIVKVKMMTHVPGRVKASIVSVSISSALSPEYSHNDEKNIADTIGSVPAHIGVADLKKICYVALHPRFLKWSKDYPLTINDVFLRHKNWLELIPPRNGQNDVDAIWDKFLSKTKTGQKFTPGTGLELYLEIDHEVFERARVHAVAVENQTMVFPHTRLRVPTKLTMLVAPSTGYRGRTFHRYSARFPKCVDSEQCGCSWWCASFKVSFGMHNWPNHHLDCVSQCFLHLEGHR